MSAFRAAFRVQRRYWWRHRLQATLCFGGVVLGVAVFCAIHLANRGALEAFRDGLEIFAGRATHRVYAPAGGGVPEGVFPRVAALPGVEGATPLLRRQVRLVAPEPISITMLGIDPFSDQAFRALRFVGDSAADENATAALERFLADPGAVALSAGLAARLGVKVGDSLRLAGPAEASVLHVVAVFDPPEGQAAAFSRTAVQDVSAHQERFGKLGKLDAIQLIVQPDAEAAVRAALPAGVELEATGRRAERVERMSRAFRLNLETLGLFALLVALFLIFNAASFSIVQRRRLLAMLRCIGASRRTVFLALLAEALLVGLAGGVLGVLAGRGLGALMLRNTGATLFEVVLSVEPAPAAVALDAQTWLIGMALALGTSLVAAWVPALAGARTSPLAAVQDRRVLVERSAALGLWVGAGLGALALTGALLLLPGESLGAGLAAATGLALGMAALCPPFTALAGRLLAAPLGWLLGAPGRMAARGLVRSLSRSGVAASSLMIALSLALSIEITVRSFRSTLNLWMDQVVTADLYLEPPAAGGRTLDDAAVQLVRGLPFVGDFAVLRTRRIQLAGREPAVIALDPDVHVHRARLPSIGVPAAEALERLRRGQVLLSEVLAYGLGLGEGDRVTVPTVQGPREFTVGAVVRNYSESQGVVYMAWPVFDAAFGPGATRHGELWLRPGASPQDAIAALEREPALASLRIVPNGALRGEAIRIFDRTFAITDLLGTLAAFVAFMAVVSALTALLEERLRSHGYLRAIGLSRRGLARSLALESALLAGVAAVASWATGLAMAWLLVHVINRRAFGWSLQFLPGEGSYGRLLLLALGAALLGSAWPIWRATRRSVTATIREE